VRKPPAGGPATSGHLRRRSPTLARFENRYHLQQHLNHWIASLPEGAGGKAPAVGHQFLGAVASLLLVGVLTAYFMLDLPRLREGLVTLFPRHRREGVAHALSVVSDKVGAYMIGNVAISVIAGTAALITLGILGIPFALPLAVFAALTDLLPMIGATLGAAACIIVGLSTASPLRNTIVLVLFFVAYQQLENYVIAARVYRNSVQMPALHVLLATLVGASLLGLLGAVGGSEDHRQCVVVGGRAAAVASDEAHDRAALALSLVVEEVADDQTQVLEVPVSVVRYLVVCSTT
jgi:predicted PurR-regulated permease PerM